MSANEINRDKLITDLKTVAQDAEELLKATAGEVTAKAKAARDKLATTLESAKTTCEKLQERAVEGVKATDEVVRQHPYESVGIAFAVGLLLGFLINRK